MCYCVHAQKTVPSSASTCMVYEQEKTSGIKVLLLENQTNYLRGSSLNSYVTTGINTWAEFKADNMQPMTSLNCFVELLFAHRRFVGSTFGQKGIIFRKFGVLVSRDLAGT
jgi:hypothetical protein